MWSSAHVRDDLYQIYTNSAIKEHCMTMHVGLYRHWISSCTMWLFKKKTVVDIKVTRVGGWCALWRRCQIFFLLSLWFKKRFCQCNYWKWTRSILMLSASNIHCQSYHDIELSVSQGSLNLMWDLNSINGTQWYTTVWPSQSLSLTILHWTICIYRPIDQLDLIMKNTY